MHKQIRIINGSLSGQGSWEPGSYAAFALVPSLSASTTGTPRASLLPAQRGRLGMGGCSGHAGQWHAGSVGPGWGLAETRAYCCCEKGFLCRAGHAQTP